MLAAREASHQALSETLQAYLSHQLPSMPPTPRDVPGTGDSTAAVDAQRFNTMVAFWAQRLQVQAAEAMTRVGGEEEGSAGTGTSSTSSSSTAESDASATTGDDAAGITHSEGTSRLCADSNPVQPSGVQRGVASPAGPVTPLHLAMMHS